MTDQSPDRFSQIAAILLADGRVRGCDRVRWVARDQVGWGGAVMVAANRTRSSEAATEQWGEARVLIEPLTVYQRTLVVAVSEPNVPVEEARRVDAAGASSRGGGDFSVSWASWPEPL